MLIGSVVLSSNSPPNAHLGLGTGDCESGQHVPGRHNGKWWMSNIGMEKDTLYLPQRDKRSTVFSWSEDPDFRTKLLDELSDLDSRFPALTQSQKYYKVQEQLGSSKFVAVVNTEGDHGSWTFFTNNVALHFYGVWDGSSVQFMWADHDIGPALRAMTSPRVWIYRLPTLEHRPLFVKTQAACSKWWKWISNDHRGDFLRSFNALELFLFGIGHRL